MMRLCVDQCDRYTNLKKTQTFAPNGELVFSDRRNHRIRKINRTSGWIETIAGRGAECTYVPSEDGGLALNACLRDPSAALYHGNDLYIADTGNYLIRRVNAWNGTIDHVVGGGSFPSIRDNVPATKTSMTLKSFTVCENKDVYIVNGGAGFSYLRRISNGVITQFSGMSYLPIM